MASRKTTALLKGSVPSKMPKPFKPMLATATSQPFNNDEWLFEIKWDGYRAVAYLEQKNVNLFSRNLQSFNQQFKIVKTALEELKLNAVLDGEIVALDETGNPNFQVLQNYLKRKQNAPLKYYVFDIIWYEGKLLTSLPLVTRKQILESILPVNNPLISYSDHIIGRGIDFYNAAVDKGLEGVMGKSMESLYYIDRRTASWLKIKHLKRTEAIICGYTKGRNSRKHFGAIILGKYEGDKLKYIGHTGGGFTDTQLQTLYKKFQPLITSHSPFPVTPKTNMPATWLKPALVCEVKFTEATKDGILRQPIFLGLREDKKATSEKNEKVVKPPVKKKSNQFLTGDSETVETKVAGKLLKFTNLNKLYWPDEGITKRDLINYYAAISPYLLPYLKDRPQSLNRFPEGIKGFNFYQKNVVDKVAAWIPRFPYTSESKGEKKEFLVCEDLATLLYMANLGCIELNPWHSRIQQPDYPDYCLIDLDPDTNTFNEVITCAQVVKEVLDSIGAPAFVKTSGSTGMHILIPLGAEYTFEQSRMLAELIVGIVFKRIPEYTSIERSPAKRKGKIYLDYLQNRQIQTMAVAYSLRPKPGATVSAPLRWEEVRKGLKISDFNITNMLDRVESVGDLLKGLLGKGINMNQILNQLKQLI
ncbi:DNA ligase D [Chitinophaga silvatica]|uniref:DNA ligase (ATP) n=1 Tax=Chitinophaga silvatica TaxID=2282649 RepID=A0A3E1YGP3_9BACT|nr:DNA ligase D [Chitinophaga silvatica]RFS26595.1 DNA ligase D [Chitinophaga silvatica]